MRRLYNSWNWYRKVWFTCECVCLTCMCINESFIYFSHGLPASTESESDLNAKLFSKSVMYLKPWLVLTCVCECFWICGDYFYIDVSLLMCCWCVWCCVCRCVVSEGGLVVRLRQWIYMNANVKLWGWCREFWDMRKQGSCMHVGVCGQAKVDL